MSTRNRSAKSLLRISEAAVLCLALASSQATSAPAGPAANRAATAAYSLIFRNGIIYDGSGGAPFVGDVAIRDDRIAAIAPHIDGRATREIDVQGKAIAPGFINMLAHPEESILVDGRAQSDLRQGVTLEVMGEMSMGPLSPQMQRQSEQRQGDIKYKVDWQTLDQYSGAWNARAPP